MGSDTPRHQAPSRGALIPNEASPYDAFELNDEYARLQQWRWPNGKPECPHCGHEDLWWLSTRRVFKCKASGCRKQFSITSGTVHHSPKCGARKLIAAIAALHNDPELSAAEIMRVTGMSYKGAYYLAKRIKQAEGIL